MSEEVAKHLKEVTKQLQYKDMYESERKERIKVENQLREANREKIETLKQLLEKEHLTVDELKKEVMQLKNQLACEKQETQKKDLSAQESKQITQKLDNNEKIIYYKELNARDEIYEKRINEVTNTFNRQLKDSKVANKKELQLRVQEIQREEASKFEQFKETHRKQLNDLQLKVEKLKEEKDKMLEDSKTHRKQLNDLQLEVEKLKEEKDKMLEDNKETHTKVLNTLKLKIEELKRDEAKKFEDSEKAYRNELQVKVEELKKKLKNGEEAQRQGNHNLTLMIEKLKKEEIKKLEELLKEQKMSAETLKKDIEKLKKENKEKLTQILVSKLKDHEKNFNKEFQEKLEVFENKIKIQNDKKIQDLQSEIDNQNHYLKQQLPFNIKEVKEDDAKPKTELQTTHAKKSEGQIKQHNKKHKQDKNSSKIVEQKARELFKDSKDTNIKSVSLDLPKLSRKITIKCGDIAEEEVDVIMVNAADNNLIHDGSVATAINVTVLRDTKKGNQNVKVVSTGGAVTTTAGGRLKCKFVVHAVWPVASHCKDQCDSLLEEVCIETMHAAESVKATSVSFPPIISDVPTNIVANVMLSTLCSYKCSKLTLLNDVRIVITERPTFEMFLNVFHSEQQNLQSLSSHIHTNSAATPDIIKPQYSHSLAGDSTLRPPPGFPLKQPGPNQSYRSYSHALLQKHEETKWLMNNAQFEPTETSVQPTANTQNNSEAITAPQNTISGVCPNCFKDLSARAIDTCKHCKQVVCRVCLDKGLYCPNCVSPMRKMTGNQPLGGIMVTTVKQQKLPGYEGYGTIQINYQVPSGNQGKEHPNPGKPYHGTARTAYVPNSPVGRKVVRLLKKAFEARLIFTVETSQTSGATGVVVWNDIPHKTSTHGGPSKSVTMLHSYFYYFSFHYTDMVTQTLHT